MNKTLDEAYDIIEKVTMNYYPWANERGNPIKSACKYEVSAIDLISTKMDALTKKI